MSREDYVPFLLNLKKEDNTDMRELCEELGMTKTTFMRRAIAQYIEDKRKTLDGKSNKQRLGNN